MATLEQRSKKRLENLKADGVRVLDMKPEGWHYIDGATTAPNGYKWAGHGSRFWRMTGGAYGARCGKTKPGASALDAGTDKRRL